MDLEKNNRSILKCNKTADTRLFDLYILQSLAISTHIYSDGFSFCINLSGNEKIVAKIIYFYSVILLVLIEDKSIIL